jgi:NADP-dependent 3-hydroxy acid dehydrogenase YdfG
MPGKTFWITGAASGLGQSVTTAALQSGHSVFATDVSLEKLEESALACGWSRSNLLLAAIDVRDEAAWDSATTGFLQR